MDVFNSGISHRDLEKLQIRVPIANYYPKFVTIEVKRNKSKTIDEKTRYHVEFRPNFFSSAMAQRALGRIETNGYEDFMLSFTKASLPVTSDFNFKKFNEIEWLNVNVGENFAQSQAIKHIVNRSSFPSPYIVFGPPGTGKTSTLVEAVAQIVKILPLSRILVTVNSNSACDEIGDRLLNFCGANKMFRFYSPSFSKKMNRVHPKLKSCSNLKYDYHIQPSIQELVSYNVIICTLVNSGRMKGLGPHHFDFIFIDECASSAEPYVDIPMTLAMKKGEKFKASVILLGDPKQLGQIMRTYHSERYGFNISLMERVMSMNAYKFPYDPRFIVQLTDNFRSHVSILHYSNEKFYNSILNAKQEAKVANFAIGWKLLPNPNIPIIFQASWSASEVDGTSQFNHGDIAFVRKYVGSLLREGINGKKVTAKDIGIISPYAAQRERLLEIYTNGIEIGTVEYFQGREKLIIIVSSVRSKTPTIGFLKNEKRLNVALTRAKALLIVIGNPETLGKNKFWSDFIAMCCKQNATVGNIPGWISHKTNKAPDTEEDEDDVVRLEEMMNEMNIED
jgi:helicase MOV-10